MTREERLTQLGVNLGERASSLTQATVDYSTNWVSGFAQFSPITIRSKTPQSRNADVERNQRRAR